MLFIKNALFLVLALFGLTAASQTFGLRGGLVLSSYSATQRPYSYPGYVSPTITGYALKPGFLFGGYVEFDLKPHLSLRTGAEYVRKGSVERAKDNNGNLPGVYNYDYGISTVDFPLNLLYRSAGKDKNHWLAGGGLVPGILLETDLKRGDLGLNALAGYAFPIGLNFTLNYTQGVLDVAGPSSYRFTSLRNHYLGIAVGYFF